jgi:hypothetical protein
MNKQKKFYVYIYRDPRPGKRRQPFYVGKGHGNRLNFHLYPSASKSNRLLKHLIAKIHRAGLTPIRKLVRRFVNEANAFKFEIALIAKYGRRDLGTGTLCNLTNGGEGLSGNLTNIAAMKARHTDPSFVEKLVEARRKLHADPEYIAGRSRHLREVQARPAVKAALLKRLAQQWDDPAYQKMQAERQRRSWANPKRRINQSKLMNALNADPKIRLKAIKSIRKACKNLSPEERAARAERARIRNADPAFQAKAQEAQRQRRKATRGDA